MKFFLSTDLTSSWRKTPFDQTMLLLRGSANGFALMGAKAWADRGSPVHGSWSHLVATLVQRQCLCRWWVCKQMWLSICSQGEQAMQDLIRFCPVASICTTSHEAELHLLRRLLDLVTFYWRIAGGIELWGSAAARRQTLDAARSKKKFSVRQAAAVSSAVLKDR